MLAIVPVAIFASSAAGVIHIKLIGGLPVTGSVPKNSPQNAVRTAVVMPKTAPINTPTGLAKGTKNVKKNNAKIGAANKLPTRTVTSKIFPETFPKKVLPMTTMAPIPKANTLAIVTWPASVLGLMLKRSR